MAYQYFRTKIPKVSGGVEQKKKNRPQKWLAVLSGLQFTQAMQPKGIPDVPDCLLYHLSREQAQSF